MDREREARTRQHSFGRREGSIEAAAGEREGKANFANLSLSLSLSLSAERRNFGQFSKRK